MNNYLVMGAEGVNLVLRRYLNGPGVPYNGDVIMHNTVPLGFVSNVTQIDINDFTILADRKLPYILIGTILSVGVP